jgi:[ribosomal protein S5]-alanine N-acetyltransferase
MPTSRKRPAIELQRTGHRVYLRAPRPDDRARFLAAAKASQGLHAGWVRAPATPALFRAYIERFAGARSRHATHAGFVVLRADDDALVGVFNFSEIVRGSFQSAYLGYYAFAPLAGEGYMAEGLSLALGVAFGALRLHRVEVNVQPDNERSLAFVRGAGFVREGFSRRYVKIAGRWRDHLRFAMLAEDWRARRRKTR